MLRAFSKTLIFFCFMYQGLSCSHERQTERAFYFWKSTLKLDEFEKRTVTEQRVSKVYIKMFDVSWNPVAQIATAVAQIKIDAASREWFNEKGISVVPTVFITNETIRNIQPENLPALSKNIASLSKSILENNPFMNVAEIQIDCDWTNQTRDKYFTLLRALKTDSLLKNRKLSATIRLYQCKYRDKTGIPPVDKGLLMCYNMGNLKNPSTKNSIIESKELEKYVGDLRSYPLPLDIAYPLFEWKVFYRNNTYSGLIQNLPDSTIIKSGIARAIENRFEILKDTVLNGYELRKGDLLREEKSEYSEIIKSSSVLSSKLKDKQLTISLYHLDSLTLSNFNKNELENIYNSLR